MQLQVPKISSTTRVLAKKVEAVTLDSTEVVLSQRVRPALRQTKWEMFLILVHSTPQMK